MHRVGLWLFVAPRCVLDELLRLLICLFHVLLIGSVDPGWIGIEGQARGASGTAGGSDDARRRGDVFMHVAPLQLRLTGPLI